MSAPLFRSSFITSRKYKVIHSQYSILFNSLRHLKIQSFNNHNGNHYKSESAQKSFLTYKLAIAGTLGCGLGYSLYKWKKDIYKKLFNYEFFYLPKVSAASILNSDISQNRNKYNFIADVVEVSAPSVVYIEIKDQKRMDFFTGKSATTSNGSGFIVSEDGLILTNAHVVINKPNTLVKVRLQDGSTYIGRVEDVDLQSDLATVRIDKNKLPVMKLGSSVNIKPGEFVVAIGSPLALSNTITSGVVSSANRQSEELGLLHKHMEYIQTDAAITFGNSGGPLVNLNGEAIGINAMKVTAGISFAIPIDYAKEFLKKAEERRHNKDNGKENSVHSRRRYIGITMLTLTREMLFELQQLVDTIPSNLTHGVLVWKVTVESPAYIGGLKPGDIITYVNKKPVKESSQIYAFVEEPGPLTVTIIRGGKTLNIHIDPEDI